MPIYTQWQLNLVIFNSPLKLIFCSMFWIRILWNLSNSWARGIHAYIMLISILTWTGPGHIGWPTDVSLFYSDSFLIKLLALRPHRNKQGNPINNSNPLVLMSAIVAYLMTSLSRPCGYLYFKACSISMIRLTWYSWLPVKLILFLFFDQLLQSPTSPPHHPPPLCLF